MMDIIAQRVAAGESVTFRPVGNSMTPRISNRELVTVTPLADDEKICVGDVVLVRVAGVVRLHLVSAVDSSRSRVQISNNHGHVNGWANIRKVYGKLREEGKDGRS